MPRIRFKLVGTSNPSKSWNATDFDYSSRAWRRTRLAWIQSNPICVHCEAMGLITPAKIVDHIRPIRFGGDAWDSSNFQSLCENCHNKKTNDESKMKVKLEDRY